MVRIEGHRLVKGRGKRSGRGFKGDRFNTARCQSVSRKGWHRKIYKIGNGTNWEIRASSDLAEDNLTNVKLKRKDERKYQAVHAADESRESRAAKTADNACFCSYRTAFASVERSAPHLPSGLLMVV